MYACLVIYLSMYFYVWTWDIFMYITVCVYMFVCVPACRGQRSALGIAPQVPSTLFSESRSLTETWSSVLGWLASEPQNLSISSPQFWGYKHMLPHLAFYTGAGNQTQVLILTQQALNQLNYVSSSFSMYFNDMYFTLHI